MTIASGTQLVLTHYGHRHIGFRRRVLDPETLRGNPMDRLLLDRLLNMRLLCVQKIRNTVKSKPSWYLCSSCQRLGVVAKAA